MSKILVSNGGFVELIETMGTDKSIVEAARVSFDRDRSDTFSFDDKDYKLLKYLMQHKHTTPFEMCEMKFHVKAPIFIARQWMRHRTASINELSGRYSEMTEDYFILKIEDLTAQSLTRKQCGTNSIVGTQELVDEYRECVSRCHELYKKMLDTGIRKEIARTILPTSLFTRWYWKIDLHNLLHFLNLRLGDDAQKEMREYATAISKLVLEKYPFTWEVFQELRYERSA